MFFGQKKQMQDYFLLQELTAIRSGVDEAGKDLASIKEELKSVHRDYKSLNQRVDSVEIKANKRIDSTDDVLSKMRDEQMIENNKWLGPRQLIVFAGTLAGAILAILGILSGISS